MPLVMDVGLSPGDLGVEVGLGVRDIVFDVDQATPRKRHTHPYLIFGLCLIYCGQIWLDG